MTVFGVMFGLSSAASCWQTFSASGSLVKVLLQDELRGDRIDALSLRAAQPALRLDRRKALVYAGHRKPEAPFELAREALDFLRQRMLAELRHRQADHDLRRAPFGEQFSDAVETRRRYGRQRMRGAQFRLADCHSNALETEIEGENGARSALRHARLRPAASRSRDPGAPWRRAGALPPARRTGSRRALPP